MKKYAVLIGFFFLPFYSFSQSKLEIEKQINKSEAPLSAQKFVDSLNLSSKVRWFVEQNHTTKTFEAKTNDREKKYSIEFNSLGKIEDIELVIEWNQIPLSTQDEICQKLTTSFEKFRIKKIQIQYSGEEKKLINFRTNTENLTIKYEIVIKGQKNSATSMYEYLFSEKGKVEEELQLDFRNTDHLDY